MVMESYIQHFGGASGAYFYRDDQGQNVASGAYFYRLSVGSWKRIGKMIYAQ